MSDEKNRPHACVCGGCQPSTYLVRPLRDPIALGAGGDHEGCQACGACSLPKSTEPQSRTERAPVVSDEEVAAIVARVTAEVLRRSH